MSKKILTLLLAAVMIFTGCEKDASDSSENNLPTDGSASVKRDYNFDNVYKKQEDALYVIQYEPIHGSKCDMILGMDIIDGYDAAWLPETPQTENFYIMNEKDQKQYATAKFYTAPPDLEKFYGTSDKEKILEEMKSSYFTVADVHDGLLKNAVQDFGYRLITDWTGKFGDYDYYLIEFQDDETDKHAIRFMVGNSKLDDTYWSFEFKADLPMDNQKLIDDHRTMLFSLYNWSN